MAHSTLVSVSLDVGLNAIGRVAKRTIAVDAMVAGFALEGSSERRKIVDGFVDGHESVTGVDEACVGNAIGTEVPIRAIEALVTYTVDVLIQC